MTENNSNYTVQHMLWEGHLTWITNAFTWLIKCDIISYFHSWGNLAQNLTWTEDACTKSFIFKIIHFINLNSILKESTNVLPKTPPPLLVHFCSRSHTINSHEEHLPRFNNAKQHLQVVKNISKDFIIWNSEVNIIIIRMWTLMYDSIHIQVQVVKFRNLRRKEKWSRSLLKLTMDIQAGGKSSW